MTSNAWPDHLLDLDEWDALPEDASRRFELVEGVLLVSPRPRLRHQETVAALAAARIPFYGIVDPGRPVVLSEFRLVRGTPPRYEHVGDHTGCATLPLGVPVTVALGSAG